MLKKRKRKKLNLPQANMLGKKQSFDALLASEDRKQEAENKEE